jgi:hypothetical protein
MTDAWQAIYLNSTDPASAAAQVQQAVQGDLDAGGFCPIASPSEEG